MSPGSWQVPVGMRPGWSWLPSSGAHANVRAMPMWVRLWCMMPLIDRYAFEWMWWHGGWAVPVERSSPPEGGVREPRHPRTPGPVADVRLEPPQ